VRSFIPNMPSIYLSLFFFYCYGGHRDLRSFPTRRSSDLTDFPGPKGLAMEKHIVKKFCSTAELFGWWLQPENQILKATLYVHDRSEEHTSELQSRENLVCRLLLEKKKKKRRKSHQVKSNT